MRRTALAGGAPTFRRSYAQAVDPLLAKVKTVPAPTWGWDALTPISNMPPDHAIQLDNFIPRPGYVEVRRGSQAWATGLGTGTTSVESLMIYNSPVGSSSKMFAAAGSTIYDATLTGVATSAVTGLTNARWQYVNHSNNFGNHYLVCANGSDTPRLYDGSNWTNMSVTASGLTSSTIIQVQTFKGRLWLLPSNSTSIYYLDVGAISGLATKFDLGPYMSKGGEIIAMATWSVDTRQSIDDYAVFITSNGRVAQAIVYAGSDPSSVDTWSLVGVYEIGNPIGRRCFFNVAGDLAILCVDGIMPMTQVLSTDRTAANRVSISANILNEFLLNARLYKGNFGWEMNKYPLGMLGILNVPTTENQTSVQFVMNVLTGAWCRFTGLNANCWAVFNDIPFFGDNTGTVRQFDVGSSDSGTAITATMRTAFNYFGSRNVKHFNLVRPMIVASAGPNLTPGLGMNVDFQSNGYVSTPVAVNT